MASSYPNNNSILPLIERDVPALNYSLRELQTDLGYNYSDLSILVEALTHSSYAREFNRKMPDKSKVPWNERLEFLGDSVLSLVISSTLVFDANHFSEGDLSRIRASLVNEKTLAAIAQELHLGKKLLLSSGERRAEGYKKPSLLADAVEALIGATFIDGGFQAAKEMVLTIYKSRLSKPLDKIPSGDFKTQLQELTQKTIQLRPEYIITGIEGPDHAPSFEVKVSVSDRLVSKGAGPSKKEASQNAARQALIWLESAAGQSFQKTLQSSSQSPGERQ